MTTLSKALRKLVNRLTGRRSVDDIGWYAPKDPTPREPCPCCDYVTLPERGMYLICPICFWEDEGLDLAQVDLGSSANHGLTLRQARRNFESFGACEEDMRSNVLPEHARARFRHAPRVLT